MEMWFYFNRGQDMIEVLTSYCARLYGRRSAKNKAKKALEAIERED